MKICKKIGFVFIILITAACSNDAKETSNSSAVASAAHGQASNQKGSDEKQQVSIESCAACHGENGVSSNTDWPNLAGQQADYLYQQLILFKQGERENVLMGASLLANYSEEDLRFIADRYSNMEFASYVVEDAFELPGAHVRARCVSCHGMTGRTVTGLWPNIAGQQAGYLSSQLLAYKNGDRIHPTMQVIASELSEQQIKDVAEYYSKVNP